MLEFTCPTCGKRVQGDDSFAGKHVVCPGCNQALTAPGTPTNTAFTDSEPLIARWPHHPEPLPEELKMPELRKAGPHIFKRVLPFLVLGGIGLTTACLLIPPVVTVRDGGWTRTQSLNNLKQIGLAMQSFHDANKRWPFNGTVPAQASDPTSGSWAFQILPYIDQAPLYVKPNIKDSVWGYTCPGRGRPSPCTTGAWTDYAINPWINDPNNGAVNAPDGRRQFDDITDGMSNTILVGHGMIDATLYSSDKTHAQSTDIFKGGDPALARRSTTSQRDKNGVAELTWGGPFANGSLMVFCDGTVRMMPYTITGGVIRNGVADGGLAVFLTPAGGENAAVPD